MHLPTNDVYFHLHASSRALFIYLNNNEEKTFEMTVESSDDCVTQESSTNHSHIIIGYLSSVLLQDELINYIYVDKSVKFKVFLKIIYFLSINNKRKLN